MQWLISQIWIALAAAGVLGILFGMAFRGLFVGNKIRRAQVERDVAKTELEQTRGEVDALYAAQRRRQEETAQTVSGGDGLQAELEAREAKIAGLGDELSAARQELDSLKAQAGTVVAAAGAAVASDTADRELSDRNVWLEERVAALEADLSAVQTPAGEAAPAAGDEELARLRWRNRYLEGRLAYYEENGETDAASEPEPETEVVEAAEVEPDANEAESDPVPVEEPASEAAAEEPAESGEEHPSDAVLKALDDVVIAPVQPPASDASTGDDLSAIEGIGPRIAEVLNGLGIVSFAQVGDWDAANVAWVEQHLSVEGRIDQERWVEQARELAANAPAENA